MITQILGYLGQPHIYKNEDGIPQDYNEAIKWWKLAAKQGHANAQAILGDLYGNGDGIPQNYAEAEKWHRLASQNGVPASQHNMGFMYETGNGVSQNYTQAWKWYHLAALQGYENARKNRKTLEKKMSPAQLKTAKKLARECAQKNYKGC